MLSMNNINEMLKNVDKKTLEKGMQQANAFMNTKEGKLMMNKIKNEMSEDKQEIMNIISKNPDIVQTIEKFFKS